MKRAGPSSASDLHKLSFKPLGSGREVGRSCHIMQFKGKTIMFDCGIHPGNRGLERLPFFDVLPDTEIDLVLITHFHLDHIASLPYLTEKSECKIKNIYMTLPTKSVARMLLSDYVRVGKSTEDGVLYDEQDVERCLAKCSLIDFHQELEIDGINITCYNAGHVLGACMYVVEISGVRILYTGDYSREDDRHLMGAEVPRIHPDVLVVESTYGVQAHESREMREERFTKAIADVVKRGGRCLLPVFSLGRAQELCLILEEYWAAHPELQGVPIYHVSKLASKALNVFQASTNYMNSNVRNKIRNAWKFQHISSYTNNVFDELGPAVVMASPGMLQNGPSRKLFEQWCPDRRNGVVLAGYCVEGTLAKKIMNESVKEFNSIEDGRVIQLNCEVKSISFAAHSDFIGTLTFVEAVAPKHVILVHGENKQMSRLRSELIVKCAKMEAVKGTDFFNPANGEDVIIECELERVVKVMGKLAEKKHCATGVRMGGLLIKRNFDEQLLHVEDVPMFTQLTSTVINQRIHVPFHSTFERLESCIGHLFEKEVVESINSASNKASASDDAKSVTEKKLIVHGCVMATLMKNRVLLEWSATPSNDMIADSMVALLLQADGGIPAIRDSQCCSLHHHHGGHSHDQDSDHPHEDLPHDCSACSWDHQPAEEPTIKQEPTTDAQQPSVPVKQESLDTIVKTEISEDTPMEVENKSEVIPGMGSAPPQEGAHPSNNQQQLSSDQEQPLVKAEQEPVEQDPQPSSVLVKQEEPTTQAQRPQSGSVSQPVIEEDSPQGIISMMTVSLLRDRLGHNMVKLLLEKDLILVFEMDKRVGATPLMVTCTDGKSRPAVAARVKISTGEIVAKSPDTRKVVEEAWQWSTRTIHPISELPTR